MCSEEFDVFESTVCAAIHLDGAFLEIGIHKAHSTLALLTILNREGIRREIWGIDPLLTADVEHERAFASCGNGHERWFLRGFSQDVFPTARLAWAFIDGCHCEPCVSEDVRRVHDQLNPGGFILVHDTRQSRRRPLGSCLRTGAPTRCEARAAVEASVLRSPEYQEVADLGAPGSCGLSVFRRIQ